MEVIRKSLPSLVIKRIIMVTDEFDFSEVYPLSHYVYIIGILFYQIAKEVHLKVQSLKAAE